MSKHNLLHHKHCIAEGFILTNEEWVREYPSLHPQVSIQGAVLNRLEKMEFLDVRAGFQSRVLADGSAPSEVESSLNFTAGTSM